MSNNNTLVDELSELLNGFHGSLSQVRCFAHILNLVVKVCINADFQLMLSESWIIALAVSPVAIQQQDKSHNGRNWRCWRHRHPQQTQWCPVRHQEESENEDSTKDSDKVDPAIVESDAAIVDKVAAEVVNDSSLPSLTCTKVNLGWFAITKVMTLSLTLTYYLCSITPAMKPRQIDI